MANNEIEARLNAVLSSVLNLDVGVVKEPSRKSLPAWDSLKHVEIMFAVEDEFSVQFSEEELNALDSAQKIVEALRQKHVA